MFSNKTAIILAYVHLLFSAFAFGAGKITSALLFLFAALMFAALTASEDENA